MDGEGQPQNGGEGQGGETAPAHIYPKGTHGATLKPNHVHAMMPVTRCLMCGFEDPYAVAINHRPDNAKRKVER